MLAQHKVHDVVRAAAAGFDDLIALRAKPFPNELFEFAPKQKSMLLRVTASHLFDACHGLRGAASQHQ